MSGEIKRYGDWVPRKGRLMVGDKDLWVKELVGAKRDAVVELMSDGLDLVELAKPLVEAYRRKGRAVREVLKELNLPPDEKISEAELDKLADEKMDQEDKNTDTIVDLLSTLEGKVLKLLSGQITILGGVILDVPENRDIILKEADELIDHPKYGFEHSPAVFKWISYNLALHQETGLMDAFLDVNDFMGLVKKYMALVMPQIAGATGAMKEASATTATA